MAGLAAHSANDALSVVRAYLFRKQIYGWSGGVYTAHQIPIILAMTTAPTATPGHSATPRALSASEKWGPSEWFGNPILGVTKAERLHLAQDALLPAADANRPCPHLTALTGLDWRCSKPGGLCAVQRYARNGAGGVSLTGDQVAICPSRIVSKAVLGAIAKTVLGPTVDAVLVKEVPYSVSLTKTLKNGEPASAGRIDWLLVDVANPKRFCAVETQSVYMSGKTQDTTFQAFVDAMGDMAMPPLYRHPDYKSSVPKRLAPQLESKARHLSSTSRKTVVLVDEFVRANMSLLHEVPVPAAYSADPEKAAKHKLNSCEVVFAIVSLSGGSLAVTEYLYCSIEAARAALNAVAAMSHADFESVVQSLVAPVDNKGLPKPWRAGKVFTL